MQIVTRLAGMGWTPKVYCLSGPGEMVAPLESAGIPVECLGATSRWSWSVLRKLRRGLQDWQPQLVQTFLFHANIAGRFAAKWAGGPVVVSGLRVAERDARWRMRLDRWTQPLVAHNVAVSQGVADFAIRECGFQSDKVTVIPNGVDLERFAAALPADLTTLGIPHGSQVLTFIGRLHEQKGPDLLLQAVLPKLRDDPRRHLLIVGDGPLREELEQAARRDAAGSQVHFAGRQPEVAGILKASRLLLVPSRWEGMPNVVLEGLAAGCPIVATSVEGVPEVLAGCPLARTVPPEDVPAFCRGIDALLAEDREKHDSRGSTQNTLDKGFAWGSVAEKYDRLYRSLLPL